jgi:hypothetical protein
MSRQPESLPVGPANQSPILNECFWSISPCCIDRLNPQPIDACHEGHEAACRSSQKLTAQTNTQVQADSGLLVSPWGG